MSFVIAHCWECRCSHYPEMHDDMFDCSSEGLPDRVVRAKDHTSAARRYVIELFLNHRIQKNDYPKIEVRNLHDKALMLTSMTIQEAFRGYIFPDFGQKKTLE